MIQIKLILQRSGCELKIKKTLKFERLATLKREEDIISNWKRG